MDKIEERANEYLSVIINEMAPLCLSDRMIILRNIIAALHAQDAESRRA
jgi:hypothetical protein